MHPLKGVEPKIDVVSSEISTWDKLVQFENAWSPMYATLDGMVTLVSVVLSSNA